MPVKRCLFFIFILFTIFIISTGNPAEEKNENLFKFSDRNLLLSNHTISNEAFGECCGPHSNCTVDINGTECNCFSGFYEVNRTCQLCDCGANGFCEVVLKTIKKCTCDGLFQEVNGKCVALPHMEDWKIIVIVLSAIVLMIFFVIAVILIKKPDWVENFCQRK